MAVEMMGNYGKEYAKVSETQQLRQKKQSQHQDDAGYERLHQTDGGTA